MAEDSTVLVTRISGAATRAADLGDRRWNELLSQHDEIVRDCVERFRGRLLETSPEGSRAAFADADHADACAGELGILLRGIGINVVSELHAGSSSL